MDELEVIVKRDVAPMESLLWELEACVESSMPVAS